MEIMEIKYRASGRLWPLVTNFGYVVSSLQHHMDDETVNNKNQYKNPIV